MGAKFDEHVMRSLFDDFSFFGYDHPIHGQDRREAIGDHEACRPPEQSQQSALNQPFRFWIHSDSGPVHHQAPQSFGVTSVGRTEARSRSFIMLTLYLEPTADVPAEIDNAMLVRENCDTVLSHFGGRMPVRRHKTQQHYETTTNNQSAMALRDECREVGRLEGYGIALGTVLGTVVGVAMKNYVFVYLGMILGAASAAIVKRRWTKVAEANAV